MAKYHLGRKSVTAHIPVCGARGRGDRYNVVVLTQKEWDALSENNRCEKCAAKIRVIKSKTDNEPE